jgi:hypothetical protein
MIHTIGAANVARITVSGIFAARAIPPTHIKIDMKRGRRTAGDSQGAAHFLAFRQFGKQ